MKKKHGDYAGVVDIARNGIDRVIMLEDECARLRAEVERLRQLVNGGRGPLPAGAVAWLDMSPGEASLAFDKKSDSNRANKRRVMELFHRVSAGYYPLYLEPQADRAERLAEALRDARDYVTTALREEREKFAGHEDCSDIPGIEADLHKIDSALNPTAAQDGK